MSIELLAPAGEKEAFLAAVKAGANAVYLGATALNARAGAGNFDREALVWAAEYAHERDVRIHVTVNTMVKEGEMGLVDDVAEQLALCGVDAAIVQDLGVAARLHKLLPSLSLHASTQMAIHNAQGAQFALDAGFSRAVLAREMNLEEIAECADTGIEVEVFGHGALCVSCSGQCLFSSLVGGRSGNRGQCAQPCRLPYRLEGAVRAQGYLLSTKDLMTLDSLVQLREAGVASLKLEGRLKRPEYVYAVTSAYRRALDLLDAYDDYAPDEETREELMQVFNRGGFTRGYGSGLIDRELMSRERPNHQGVPVGQLTAPGKLALTRDVLPEDALILRAKRADEDVPLRGVSGRAGETVRARVPAAARPIMPLYRLTSQEQMERIHEALNDEPQTVLLSGFFRAQVGEKACLQLTDGERAVRVESPEPLAPAKKPGDPERARTQLQKTGGTPYQLIDLSLSIDPGAFLPASLLNELRRDALRRLSQARVTALRGCKRSLSRALPPELPELPAPKAPLLRVEGSDWALLRRLHGADELIFRPEDLSAEGLDQVAPDRPFSLALPMTCSAEALDRLCDWAQANQANLTAVYIANPGQLVVPFPGMRRADFSLNLANREALAFLAGQGIDEYTPSVELTAQELRQMDAAGGHRELIVYGRLPLMQLRHCPIRAALDGPHASCRRCDSLSEDKRLNAHVLIDRKNVAFPLRRVRSDEGCLVRVLNSAPLFLLRHAGRLPESAAWRLVLTDETEAEAQSVLRLHRLAIEGGDVRAASDWPAWDAKNTTTGYYFR